MILSIPMQGKRVLLVGGGTVALRKAKSFLKEQAIVHVVAKTIDEELKCLAFSWEERAYETKDVIGYFLVVAASDDIILNQRIVRDAKQVGCLGLSVHHQTQQPHTLLAYEEDHIQLAVSTNGAYPAMNRRILTRMQEVWNTEYKDSMVVLCELRPYLLRLKDKQKAHTILKQLPNYTMDSLQFLLRACQTKTAVIHAFHGVKDPISIQTEILPFLACQQQEQAHGFAYLSAPVLRCVNAKQHLVFSLQELLDLLQMLNITTKVQAMLLQAGSYYQQVCDIANAYGVEVMALLLQEKEAMQQHITMLEQLYAQEGKSFLIIYHANEGGELDHNLSTINVQSNTILCREKEVATLDHTKLKKHVIIYSFYMLSGYHMKLDQELRKHFGGDHEVTCISHSYLQEVCTNTTTLSMASYD